jgi:cytochrome c5
MSFIRGAIFTSAGAALVSLIVAGCQMSARSPDVRAASAPVAAPAAPVKVEKGGAELWSETCSHCHNLRSPSSFGPAQWEVAVYDMRVRAHLTGEEQRKITEFLKAASQ